MISLASRRQARALALQILYAGDGDTGTDVGAAVELWPAGFELEIDDEGRALARRLAGEAVKDGVAIDERIAGASRNWRLERMGRVDRNILRLAVGELTSSAETPVRIVINEAVELAKRFGTADSAAFVNGLLDRIAAGLGRDREAAATAGAAARTDSDDAAAAAEPPTASDEPSASDEPPASDEPSASDDAPARGA